MTSNASIECENPVHFTDSLKLIYPTSAFLESGFASSLNNDIAYSGGAFSLLVNNARLVLIGLLFLLPFVVNYLVLWLFFQASQRSKKTGKMPPTIPYLVPFLGSTIPYLWNPSRFVRSST